MRLVGRILDYRAARRADAAMTDKKPSEMYQILADDPAALRVYIRMLKLDQEA